MLRKSAVIAANQIFIIFKIVIIREVKEAGAVGKWAGGPPTSLSCTPVRYAALHNPGYGSRKLSTLNPKSRTIREGGVESYRSVRGEQHPRRSTKIGPKGGEILLGN
jgi:hypothetical protein